jgi:hypothetical protein
MNPPLEKEGCAVPRLEEIRGPEDLRALSPQAAREPAPQFCRRLTVAPGSGQRAAGSGMTVVAGEDGVECGGELAVPVTGEQPEASSPLLEIHENRGYAVDVEPSVKVTISCPASRASPSPRHRFRLLAKAAHRRW